MKSGELLNLKDLSDWKICKCYWAQLKHGCWGTFPALFSRDGGKKAEWEPFVCTSKDLIGKAVGLLRPRSFKIEESLCMVRTNGEVIGFDLEAMIRQMLIGKESVSLSVVSESDLSHRKNFKWAPGLVSNDMSAAEFADTIKEALIKLGEKS